MIILTEIPRFVVYYVCVYPSGEFELKTNSLGAYLETHGGFISRTLSYLTVNSQDDSHCELAVSFP